MHLLWIVVDSLRRDRLGCYGCPRPTTPNLDRLAGQSLRFDQAISPHIPTHPAHTTFFSGRDVFEHQVVAQGGHHDPGPCLTLLPALLREQGWFTGAVDNIGRWIAPAFERYVESPRWDHDGGRPWRTGEEVTERALGLLGEAAASGRPSFLFLHYWDPHTPYLPPPPFDRMFYEGDEKAPNHTSMEAVWASPWFASYFSEWLPGVRDIAFVTAQYDASVAYADACVAGVLQRLEDLGLAGDTLVVLHSDHGEELDDHGCWFDHHGLYDTNVRVPLLLRMPDGRGAGSVVEGQVSLVDLPAAVLRVLGLPVPEGMERAPILPWDEGHCGRGGIYLTECTWMRKRGWRTPEWKLIEALEPDIYGKPAVELFDLTSDPGETDNLSGTRPEAVAELTAARDAHVARRLRETGGLDPLLAQADALRIWQPRFIAGKRA